MLKFNTYVSDRTDLADLVRCPRHRLPSFQIRRAHAASDWIDDIYLVDTAGNETDIGDHFNKSDNLITGGYTNGADALESMNTLTVNANDVFVDSAIKTTTGAGIAGFAATDTFAVANGEKLYLKVTLTLNSGVAPKVFISDGGDSDISNEVLLVSGENNIILTATEANINATLLFYNATGDQSNFSLSPITLVRSNRPRIKELTSYDYIQYSGQTILKNDKDILTGWSNIDYGTLTTSGAQISSAISLSTGSAYATPLFTIDSVARALKAGERINVVVDNLTLNSGDAPQIYIADTSLPTAICSNIQTVAEGDSEFTLTITQDATTSAKFYLTSSAAANFSIDSVYVYVDEDLSEKDTYYLKVTDGVNTWYSEWFVMDDICKNIISSWAQDGTYPFTTLATSGTKILSAIRASGASAQINSGTFAVTNNEEISVILFLTRNSGENPFVSMRNTSGSICDTDYEISDGINVITLTASKTDPSAFIKIYKASGENVDFSTSEIIVIRNYSDFIKLDFSNTKDLGLILYQDNYENSGWVKGTLKHGEHSTSVIATEIDGIKTIEETISQQIRVLRLLLTESQYHLLQTLPAHDTVTITDKIGTEYTAKNIEVGQPQWIRNYCRVEIRFTTSDDVSIYRINEDNLT